MAATKKKKKAAPKPEMAKKPLDKAQAKNKKTKKK